MRLHIRTTSRGYKALASLLAFAMVFGPEAPLAFAATHDTGESSRWGQSEDDVPRPELGKPDEKGTTEFAPNPDRSGSSEPGPFEGYDLFADDDGSDDQDEPGNKDKAEHGNKGKPGISGSSDPDPFDDVDEQEEDDNEDKGKPASVGKPDEAALTEKGTDAFLSKPCGVDQVLQAVENVGAVPA